MCLYISILIILHYNVISIAILKLTAQVSAYLCCSLSFKHWNYGIKARQPTGCSLWISLIISLSLSVYSMGP